MSLQCRMTSRGSSLIVYENVSPRLKWRSCGGMGDLASNWRVPVELGNVALSSRDSGPRDWACPHGTSSISRTRFANDGLSSKNFFTPVSCLDIFFLVPYLSCRNMYFWQDSVNARSARDEFLRSTSRTRNGNFVNCSTSEAERRESGKFSMFKEKRSQALTLPWVTGHRGWEMPWATKLFFFASWLSNLNY